MKKLLKDFGIEPKVIDYGEYPENNRYREIDEESRLFGNKLSNIKKKNKDN